MLLESGSHVTTPIKENQNFKESIRKHSRDFSSIEKILASSFTIPGIYIKCIRPAFMSNYVIHVNIIQDNNHEQILWIHGHEVEFTTTYSFSNNQIINVLRKISLPAYFYLYCFVPAYLSLICLWVYVNKETN